MTKQMSKPTVLNNEEYSSKYILFNILNILDNKIFNNVIIKSMNLVQEVLFMYSRKETNDILEKTKTIANTFYFKRHSAFSLRRDYVIIAIECICCIDRGEVINRPPENERK